MLLPWLGAEGTDPNGWMRFQGFSALKEMGRKPLAPLSFLPVWADSVSQPRPKLVRNNTGSSSCFSFLGGYLWTGPWVSAQFWTRGSLLVRPTVFVAALSLGAILWSVNFRSCLVANVCSSFMSLRCYVTADWFGVIMRLSIEWEWMLCIRSVVCVSFMGLCPVGINSTVRLSPRTALQFIASPDSFPDITWCLWCINVDWSWCCSSLFVSLIILLIPYHGALLLRFACSVWRQPVIFLLSVKLYALEVHLSFNLRFSGIYELRVLLYSPILNEFHCSCLWRELKPSLGASDKRLMQSKHHWHSDWCGVSVFDWFAVQLRVHVSLRVLYKHGCDWCIIELVLMSGDTPHCSLTFSLIELVLILCSEESLTLQNTACI